MLLKILGKGADEVLAKPVFAASRSAGIAGLEAMPEWRIAWSCFGPVVSRV
jgi:hypothetical protein